MPTTQQKYDTIININNKIKNINIQKNPYTNLTKKINKNLTFSILNYLILTL